MMDLTSSDMLEIALFFLAMDCLSPVDTSWIEVPLPATRLRAVRREWDHWRCGRQAVTADGDLDDRQPVLTQAASDQLQRVAEQIHAMHAGRNLLGEIQGLHTAIQGLTAYAEVGGSLHALLANQQTAETQKLWLALEKALRSCKKARACTDLDGIVGEIESVAAAPLAMRQLAKLLRQLDRNEAWGANPIRVDNAALEKIRLRSAQLAATSALPDELKAIAETLHSWAAAEGVDGLVRQALKNCLVLLESSPHVATTAIRDEIASVVVAMSEPTVSDDAFVAKLRGLHEQIRQVLRGGLDTHLPQNQQRVQLIRCAEAIGRFVQHRSVSHQWVRNRRLSELHREVVTRIELSSDEVDRVFRQLLAKLSSALRKATIDKLRRLDRQLQQLSALSRNPSVLEPVRAAVSSRLDLVSGDALALLRAPGTGAIIPTLLDHPRLEQLQLRPPCPRELAAVKGALDELQPAHWIAELAKKPDADQCMPETISLLRSLEGYRQGLQNLEDFVGEYMNFLRGLGRVSITRSEARGFSAWLRAAHCPFAWPATASEPASQVVCWLLCLSPGQREQMLARMLVGNWNEAVGQVLEELGRKQPSKFLGQDAWRVSPGAREHALRFILAELVRHRPFQIVCDIWETVCPANQRGRWENRTSFVDQMLKVLREAREAYRSALAAGASDLPPLDTVDAQVSIVWDYLHGAKQLKKRTSEITKPTPGTKFFGDLLDLDLSLPAPPEAHPVEDDAEAWDQLATRLVGLLPTLYHFYELDRRRGWVTDLINQVLRIAGDQKRPLAAGERGRKSQRIKFERRKLFARSKELLDDLKAAAAALSLKDQALLVHIERIDEMLNLHHMRQNALQRGKTPKKAGKKSRQAARNDYVWDCEVRDAADRLMRLADQIDSSCHRLSRSARELGDASLEELVRATTWLAVDVVFGFARGPIWKLDRKFRVVKAVDKRPVGLQYLILRRLLDEDRLSNLLGADVGQGGQ